MQAQKQSYNIQKLVVATAVLLFVVKLVAWQLTHSVAILTDALESTVNVISGFIGLYSLYLSSLPRDRNHPYGHGKVEFISAAVEGTLIIVAGLFIIYEAVVHLIHPQEITQLDYGIYLVAFSGLINFVVGYYCVKYGRKNNSLALVASGRHLQSDTYTTIGLVIGLIIIALTGLIWLDSVVAFVFAAIIIYTGYKILRESIAGIMDEADRKLLKEVVQLLNDNKRENWVDLHNLRIIKYGRILHMDCHLTVPWYLNVREAHHEIESLAALVESRFGQRVELFVHSDACIESSCRICPKQVCPPRQHDFEKRVNWTVENISNNSKHSIEDAG